jgi:hypothetical protein
VLVGLDVGLDVLRRHQPRIVPELAQLARPVMRAWLPAPTTGGRRGAARAAGLEADPTARQIGEERQHLGARQAPPQPDRAVPIDAVHLEHALGDVQPDRGHLHLARLPRSWLFSDFHLGTSMPSAGGVHLIIGR